MKTSAYRPFSFLLFIAVALMGCSQELPEAPAPRPPEVTVASPEVKDIIDYFYFTGYTEARVSVDLQARVEGYLTTVAFPSGGMIEKGDLLFGIDPRPYEAEVAQKAASLKIQQAEAELATATLKRKESSFKQRAVSELAVLEARAEVSKSKAEVTGAEAALTEAELNLSYTKIYSPIKGRISRNFIDTGNLVGNGGNKTQLANIVNFDPIFVYFSVDERSLMLFKQHNKKRGHNISTLSSRKFPIFLNLEGESEYSRQGAVEYMDSEVDHTTGTIQVRASFENSDLFILPGMYAKIRIPVQEIKEALLVPEVALSADQRGRFLLTVDSENKVVYKSVKIGALQDGMRVITEGISSDDRVIVKGIQRARPGSPVTPIQETDTSKSSDQIQIK